MVTIHVLTLPQMTLAGQLHSRVAVVSLRRVRLPRCHRFPSHEIGKRCVNSKHKSPMGVAQVSGQRRNLVGRSDIELLTRWAAPKV